MYLLAGGRRVKKYKTCAPCIIYRFAGAAVVFQYEEIERALASNVQWESLRGRHRVVQRRSKGWATAVQAIGLTPSPACTEALAFQSDRKAPYSRSLAMHLQGCVS